MADTITVEPDQTFLKQLIWVFTDCLGLSFSKLTKRVVLLAHLSRRLIGELIVYPRSVVRLSVVLRPQCSNIFFSETRRDVPVGVPLDLSTPTGMSCIGTYGENCKSDNVSKYCVLLVAFLLLWHENLCHGKIQ